MPDRHPTVRNFRRVAGQAGHVNYYVEVEASGDDSLHLVFAGNIFVGPVLMSSMSGDGRWKHQTIDHPRQFGEFVSAEWVGRFLDSWYEALAA